MERFEENYKIALEKNHRTPLLYLKDRLPLNRPGKFKVWANNSTLIYSDSAKPLLFRENRNHKGTETALAYASIRELFDIAPQDELSLLSAIIEAGNGRGNEMESLALTNLLSSSLCALMCFFRISEAHPFVYDGIAYVKTIFEKENPGLSQIAPSCPDVVLLDTTGEHMLVLEIKFSEYTDLDRREIKRDFYETRIANGYLDHFDLKNSGNQWDNITIENEKITSNQTHYLQGVRQLLTHVYGISHMSLEECEHLKTVKYREVVMNFGQCDEKHYFEDFNKVYSELACYLGKINQSFLIANPKVKIDIATQIVPLQSMFKDNMDLLLPSVCSFYGIGDKNDER